MKRCKICGWYFEPKSTRQAFCDDECRKESLRRSWRNSKRKKYQKEKQAEERKKLPVLKCDPSKLPKPSLPPTKEVRILPPPTPGTYNRLIANQWPPSKWESYRL